MPAGLSAPGNDDNDNGNNEVPLYVPILNSLVSSIKGQVNVQGKEVLTTQQTIFQMESRCHKLKWELEDVRIQCEDETSPAKQKKMKKEMKQIQHTINKLNEDIKKMDGDKASYDSNVSSNSLLG